MAINIKGIGAAIHAGLTGPAGVAGAPAYLSPISHAATPAYHGMPGGGGAMKGYSNIFDTSDLDAKDLKASAISSRIKIEVFYNQGPENMARVDSTDTKTGKTDSILCRHPVFASRAVRALQDRDGKVVRAIKKLEKEGDFPDLLLDEWKNGRCLFQGVPNKAAMLLLSGLQRDFSAPLVRTKDGGSYRGGPTLRSLREANVLDVVMTPAKRTGYRTNLRGHEVLVAWSKRSPAFNRYLNAFLPEGWEQRTKARLAINAMRLGASELMEYSPAFGYITSSMKKLGIR